MKIKEMNAKEIFLRLILHVICHRVYTHIKMLNIFEYFNKVIIIVPIKIKFYFKRYQVVDYQTIVSILLIYAHYNRMIHLPHFLTIL